MKIAPKLKVFVDWFSNSQYIDETQNLMSATFQAFNVDMLSSIQPKAKPTSGQVVFANVNGRFSLNNAIPNKDTSLESALSNFPIDGVQVVITLEDNSDPDIVSDRPIFYGSLNTPSASGGTITFKLQNKLSSAIQKKRTTQTFEYEATQDLVQLIDDTGKLYANGGFPIIIDFSSIDDESSIEAVMKLIEASLGYVVSDNSPVVNIYPYDYMLVKPLDPMTINVGRAVESRAQFVSRFNVFDRLGVEYINTSIKPKEDLIRDKTPIMIEAGETNVTHEVKLSSQLIYEDDADASWEIASNGDATKTSVIYELFASKIVLTTTNTDNLPSYIINLTVNGNSISLSNKQKVFVETTGSTADHSRTFPNNEYIQSEQHAKWIANVLVDRMNRFGIFDEDFVILKNVVPKEKYVFGRPINLIDEYGRQKKYYIFAMTVRFSSTTGVWMDLTLVSKKYLYGDETTEPPTCLDPFIIGSSALDNTKVCAT